MLKKLLTAFIYYIIVVVVADLTGVLAVTLLDIIFTRFESGALYYAIWFVLAVFAGIFYISVFLQRSRGQLSPGDGILASSVSLVLSALLIIIFHLAGEMQASVANYDYYVPGNKYVTYTFFITFVATAFLCRNFVAQKDKPLT
jgi:hypothetical protein